ncbi:hypothetical protein [Planctomycetes bacterium TBK1r]|uniref:Uncharacterized protein n=1 Tax=Stieleria magnilauensis TaxID=2527963 RepID=A0ABX5XSM0_9BACT|nr:hypothetical protein TBK1r_35830 [Planctomycetes bacterium TBK1r]
MKSSVCTLFEGHYHYGVAALTNSLYQNGYRGTVYAGYRGGLPGWTVEAERRSTGQWSDATSLQVADGLEIVFLPLETPYHLTNYKPDFMLELLDGPAADTDAIFYLDPDICVADDWQVFCDWVSCGVALCEDVNSPLPKNHPRRVGWRRYYENKGFSLNFKGREYVNGGFVGLRSDARGFLEQWKALMLAMGDVIGGLGAAKVELGQEFEGKGFFSCFDASDQDGLNAAIEATDFEFSVIGQEAMGFKPGAAILPHALGQPKPWKKRFLGDSLKGKSPRLVDKEFLKNVSPIGFYMPSEIFMRRLSCFMASGIGRFVRRA